VPSTYLQFKVQQGQMQGGSILTYRIIQSFCSLTRGCPGCHYVFTVVYKCGDLVIETSR